MSENTNDLYDDPEYIAYLEKTAANIASADDFVNDEALMEGCIH